MNESLPLNRKFVATGRTVIKDSLKICFHEMNELLPVGRIFEELE